MTLARQLGSTRPLSKSARSTLNAEVGSVRDEILKLLAGPKYLDHQEIAYLSEEDLLIHGVRTADFLILELADHFRSYDVRQLPAFLGVEYVTSVPRSALVRKRVSGHVTSGFSEAMCPWVMERIGISNGELLRLKALSPTVFGRHLPDLVFPSQGQEVPCEVKHYADAGRLSKKGIGTAIAQVVAAMLVFSANVGYIFLAISHPATGHRYKIEVIRLDG
jgi:hypothetical protein